MVGVSSQVSTGSMSSCGEGMIRVPVKWGLLCLSRKTSSYVGGRPAVAMRANLAWVLGVMRATMSPDDISDGAGKAQVRSRFWGSCELMLLRSLVRRNWFSFGKSVRKKCCQSCRVKSASVCESNRSSM